MKHYPVTSSVRILKRFSFQLIVLFVLTLTARSAPPASWQGPGIAPYNANAGNLNLLPGQLVGTCFSRVSNNDPSSDPEGFVLAVFDTRDPIAEGAIPGNLWRTDSLNPVAGPFYRYHGDNMRAKVLGEVFGVCVSREDTPDIWVTGTSAYAADASGWDNTIAPNNTLPPGSQLGRVYRIDNVTGNPVDVVALNNSPIASGPRPAELGNICWNRSGNGNEWVYVSNINDGLIYRLEANNLQGSQLTFDHGVDARPNESLSPVADNPATEVTDHRRVVWGLQVCPADGRLYYSVFNGLIAPCEIWSVELDSTTGAFLPATARLDITVPTSPQFRAPLASLQFSSDGNQLFAAERGHSQLGTNGAHSHRILEWTYDPSGPAWNLVPEITPTPTYKYHLGSAFGGQNSAGGVQPDCEGNVWVTGNFYSGTTAGSRIYGAQRIPAGGNFATAPEQSGSTSLWIDYNDSPVEVTKYALGALAMWEPCGCMEIEVGEIECPREPDEPFTITLDVTNLSGQTATIGWIRPCPEADLPSGATSVVPSPATLFPFNTPVANGDQTTITFQVPFDPNARTVCFSLTLFDEDLNECCTEKFCFDLPDCDCAEIIDQDVQSETLANGDIKHTITITVFNLTHLSGNPYPFSYATVPPQPGFVSFDATPTPDPILPGQSGTFTFCYICPLLQQPCPDKLITTIGFHDGTVENCCSLEVCIELPPGDKVTEPDTCQIINRNVVACPDPTGQGWYADIRVYICNNFCEPRTYDWGVNPQSANVISIAPNSGLIGPIPPGECEIVSFRILGNLEPGQNGTYSITFTPTDGGPSVTCRGDFTRPEDPVKVIGGGAEPQPGDLTGGQVVRLDYQVVNDGSEEVTVPLLFSSQFGAFLIGPFGEQPDQLQYSTTVTVPAGEKVDLSLAIRLEDPSRRDLPRFVEVDVFRLDDFGPFGHLPQARAIPIPRAPALGDPAPVVCLNCSNLVPVTAGSNALFQLRIEVSVESLTIQVEKSEAIPNWQPAQIRLSETGDNLDQVTLSRGQHTLFIENAGLDRCFFRLLF